MRAAARYAAVGSYGVRGVNPVYAAPTGAAYGT